MGRRYVINFLKMPLNKALIAGLIIILGLAGFLFACIPNPKPDKPATKNLPKSIRVVMDNNYPPYAFLDGNGNLQGILIDQWRLWESKTGIKVNLTGLDWSEAQKQMEAGKFDVIDTIFFNANRSKIYDFTPPYATLDVPIYFNNKISGITGPESLKGFTIAVKSGDAAIDFLQSKGITRLQEFASYEEIIQAAKNNEVVIFTVDKPPAEYFLYLYGIQNEFNSTQSLYSGQFHRAVKKGNKELLTIVQNGFALISESEFKAIDQFWFGTPLINFDYLKYAGIAGGVILSIILLMLGWNRSLHVRVERKTKELAEQESLFRQLTESIKEVFFMRDSKTWQTIYASPTFETVWSRSREDLYAEPNLVLESIHPEDRERVKTAQKRLQDEGAEYSVVYRIIRSDGSMRWIKAQAYPVCDENGNTIRVAGIAEDITERKQVDDDLRNSENKLRSLFASMTDVIIIYDSEGRYLEIAPTDPGYLSNPPEELINRTVSEIFPKPLADFFQNTIRRALREGKIIGAEYCLAVDGTDYWFSANISAMTPNTVIWVARDITERKHQEEALRENEKRYQGLLDNLGEGISIINTDQVLSYANPAAHEIFGVEKNGLIGSHINKYLVPGSNKSISGIPFREFLGKTSILELDIIRPDGNQRTLQVSARQHLDAEGNLNGIFCTFHDITERKQAEQILKESEERFRYIFEQVAVGFSQVDSLTGQYVKINQKHCDIVGYTREEMLTKTFKDITHPDDLNKEDVFKEKLRRGEINTYSFEKRYLRKDGATIWINLTVSSMWAAGEQPTYDIAVVEDITERKRTEEALEKSRQQLILAIEGSGVGIWDWMVQTGETIINDRWAEIVGYTREELIPTTEQTWRRLGDPKDFETSQEILKRHIAGEIPYCEYEARMRHKDGHWVWVLVHCKVTEWDELGGPVRITGTHLDISERKKTEEAIRENEFWLTESQRVGRIGSYVLDISMGNWICSQVLDDIFGINHDYEKTISTWSGLIHPDDRDMMVQYFSQHVLKERNSFDKEYRIVRSMDGEERWVWGRGELIFDKDGNPLRMIGTIQDITEQKQADVVLWQTTQELKTAYDATLQGWSNALEMRERETAGHSQRVVQLTLEMARMLDFSDEEIVHIQRGALLHDIGKMGIPDSILLKPGPLSEDEWVIMRLHPTYAYRLLSKIPYLLPALDIPYCHHEHYDGSGYPRGLKGKEIPLAARIFAIVDVWDALLSDRPYRPAWTEEAVLNYLKSQSEKLFDPEVVEKFYKLVSP